MSQILGNSDVGPCHRKMVYDSDHQRTGMDYEGTRVPTLSRTHTCMMAFQSRAVWAGVNKVIQGSEIENILNIAIKFRFWIIYLQYCYKAYQIHPWILMNKTSHYIHTMLHSRVIGLTVKGRMHSDLNENGLKLFSSIKNSLCCVLPFLLQHGE